LVCSRAARKSGEDTVVNAWLRGVEVKAKRLDFATGETDGRHYFWGSNMNFDWADGAELRAFCTY
jgi:hypothetical protein